MSLIRTASFRFLLLCCLMILFVSMSDAGDEKYCCSTKAPRMLAAFHENILKRRTRSVVFPRNAQLLLTPSFTKSILGGIPRGLVYSMEFDMYSPLPDTIDGWKPKILLNQIEREKKRNQVDVTTTAEVTSMSNVTNANAVDDVYNSESLHMDKHNFYQFDFPGYGGADDNSWDFAQSRLHNEEPYLFREMQEIPMEVQPHLFHAQRKNFHLRPYKRKTQLKSSAESDFISSQGVEFLQNKHAAASVWPSWYENHNYRQRRELFDQLEAAGKIFNINAKECIKRAICEMTLHLKPYGESLMDDIIRILLTLPVPSDVQVPYDDDYSHRYDVGVNCAREFTATCPYRIMNILTQNFKNKMP